jgi:PhnB protein
MQLNPYLFFDGRCEEAFKFYEKLLGGAIKAMMTYESAPAEEQGEPEWKNKIMHATLEIHGAPLMGSDAPPKHYSKPAGFSVSLSIDKVADAERIFGALADGGKIGFPLQQTFWAARFGMVTDRFGIPWMINCERDA